VHILPKTPRKSDQYKPEAQDVTSKVKSVERDDACFFVFFVFLEIRFNPIKAFDMN